MTESSSMQVHDQDTSCCAAPHVIECNGEMVCSNCGMVQGAVLSKMRPRAYSIDEIEERHHHEIYKPYTRRMFYPFEDVKNPERRALFSRLYRFYKDFRPSQERMKLKYCKLLRMRGSGLQLPSFIIETAENYLIKCHAANAFRGRSVHDFIEACLLLACRTFGNAMFMYSDMDEFDYSKPFYIITLVRKICGCKGKVLISDVIRRSCNELALSNEQTNRILALGRRVKLLQGRDVRGYVAALIYFTCNMTQDTVAKSMNVTDVTIRSRVKEIKKQLGGL